MQFRIRVYQNVGNQNGQIVVPGITNQNPNGNGNVVAARAEGNATGNNDSVVDCSKGRSRNPTPNRKSFDLMLLQQNLMKMSKISQLHLDEANLQSSIDIGNSDRQKPPVYANTRSGLSVEQEGGTVDQHLLLFEGTTAYF
ncbi:hypothetical protein Tco_0621827 [Tanacetum coccineum]